MLPWAVSWMGLLSAHVLFIANGSCRIRFPNVLHRSGSNNLLNRAQGMGEIMIEKILGSSVLMSPTLSVHYIRCLCICFACFFSTVLPSESPRVELEVCEDCREIKSLTFSTNGDHVVLREIGLNARFLILTLYDAFARILTETEFRTKEIAFSCLAMDSQKGRLITVVSDRQPYFLLWDTMPHRPACMGCSHVALRLTHVSLSSDSKLAFLCGPRILKFVECDRPRSTLHSLRSHKRCSSICYRLCCLHKA
jgi:hypothetical protein